MKTAKPKPMKMPGNSTVTRDKNAMSNRKAMPAPIYKPKAGKRKS